MLLDYPYFIIYLDYIGLIVCVALLLLLTNFITGNEGYGVSEAIKRECSVMLSVPPYRHLPSTFDSLNVAVATGIVLHPLQVNKSRT